MNRSASFGDTWREQPLSFWNEMWRLHKDSEMTRTIVQRVSRHPRVLEIGCGAGHIFEAIVLHCRSQKRRPPDYIGIDISAVARKELENRAKKLDYPVLTSGGDFVHRLSTHPNDPTEIKRYYNNRSLVFSRGVLQHQPHWAPMVLGALRLAPEVMMGIGYVTDETHHVGGWQRSGHYDITVSLPLLGTEARAIGLGVTVEKFHNEARRCAEALVTFTR